MSEVMKIIIEGEWRGARAFVEAKQGVQELKIVTEGAGVAQTRMGEYADLAYQKMARGIWQGIRLFGWMEMSMMRVEVAQSILASSQDRYMYALEEYGAGSRQAIMAQRELERVTNYVERANLRAALATGSFVVQMMLETGVLKGATMELITNKAATVAASIADAAHSAILWSKAHALTILTFGLAAAAGAAAWYAYQSRMATQEMKDTTLAAEQLSNTIGQPPSTGLIKGFEALGSAMEQLRFVSAPTFNIKVSALDEDVDRLMRSQGKALKRAIRSVM